MVLLRKYRFIVNSLLDWRVDAKAKTQIMRINLLATILYLFDLHRTELVPYCLNITNGHMTAINDLYRYYYCSKLHVLENENSKYYDGAVVSI
jgi:hypothetical protein